MTIAAYPLNDSSVHENGLRALARRLHKTSIIFTIKISRRRVMIMDRDEYVVFIAKISL